MFETMTFEEVTELAVLGDVGAAEHVVRAAKTSVQSVICSKQKFDSAEAASKWVSDHDFSTDKVDETSVSYRFRQFDPGQCQKDTLRTIQMTAGVAAVVCRKKGEKEAAPLRLLLDNLDVAEYRQQFEDLISKGETFALRRDLAATVKDINEMERTVTHLITSDSKDRMGDIVRPDGGDLTRYAKNPVVLWAHDSHSLPIGRNVWMRREGNGILAKTEFYDRGLGDEVFRMYQKRFLNAFSIGFLPKKFERMYDNENFAGYDFKEWELLEYSAVPVPANQDALRNAFTEGVLQSRELLKCFSGQCELIDKTLATEEAERAVAPHAAYVKEAVQEVFNTCASPMHAAMQQMQADLKELTERVKTVQEWINAPMDIDIPEAPAPQEPTPKPVETLGTAPVEPRYIDITERFRAAAAGEVSRLVGKNGKR